MFGDTQITIAGNLVDDPELRFTLRVAGGQVPHREHAPLLRQGVEQLEGRRLAVPDRERVAAGR